MCGNLFSPTMQTLEIELRLLDLVASVLLAEPPHGLLSPSS